MSQYNLDRMFQPRRVAVVGASESTGSIGNVLMKNLIEGGFQGKLLHENRNMVALGKKLGFGANRAPDSRENVLTIYFG